MIFYLISNIKIKSFSHCKLELTYMIILALHYREKDFFNIFTDNESPIKINKIYNSTDEGKQISIKCYMLQNYNS